LKKNLLYITHSTLSKSETFLRDTIKYLSAEFNITFASGGKNGDHIKGVKTFYTNYHYPRHYSKLLWFLVTKISKKSTQFHHWESRIKHSFRNLKKIDGRFDFAIVEYGESAVLAYDFLKSKSIPFGITFHGYDASKLFGDREYTKRILTVSKDAKFIFVPSKHIRNRLVLENFDSSKIHIAPCDPNYEVINSLPKPVINNNLVVSLGRLTNKKCPEALILTAKHVLKQKANTQFIFIGGGAHYNYYQDLIRFHEIEDNVILKGSANHIDALKLLSECVVFIQHSVTSAFGDQEGFPVSIAEASLLKKPIVSTIHSGITEGVIHDETGFLVQEHDFESMGDYIITLLSDPKLANEMGNNGCEFISKSLPNNFRNKLLSKNITSFIHENISHNKSS
jgi:colanic acid/amylovoran biosynthesis glycosyltransferase